MRRTIALFAVLTATTLAAQTTKPAPPPLGPIVSYQYWPTQYIQFVTGPELPYTLFMFEADTSGKQPLYHAAFTGKDGTTTNYSNTDALAAYYKATGAASYKVDFAVESDESEKVGATTTVRFTAHDEKAVEFRFVQGSDISAQGSGLQPLPEAPVPVFAYRELGGLAGEGTALKVGNAVSTAEVWKEYAHPPYFVPYRGAVTTSAHLIVFPKAAATWTVTQYPSALTAGSTWELDEAHGDHMSLKIDKVDGSHFTLSATDRYHPAIRKTMEATRTGDGWTTERVILQPASKGGDKHAVTLLFTPGLSSSGTVGAAGAMDLSVAKKQKVVTATVTPGSDGTALQFTAPAWAAKESLTEQSSLSGDTLILSAK